MPNDRTQDVAVVGSPSTNTELTVDLLQEAIEERLVGALTSFEAVQNGQGITSVGQIVGIELRNRWHEDSVFRNLVKRTGEIPPITNRQDTRIADLVVGATFRQTTNGFEPVVLARHITWVSSAKPAPGSPALRRCCSVLTHVTCRWVSW